MEIYESSLENMDADITNSAAWETAETSAEIPHWWRGTTNQKQHPDLGSDASSV